jgi:hypothetical protein
MPAPSIADPAVATRPAHRRRARALLRAVPEAGPTVTADAVVEVSVAAVPEVGPPAVDIPAGADPGSSGPLTVTISVDGGAPEVHDRLLDALRDLVATVGGGAVAVGEAADGPAGVGAGEPGVVHVDPEPRAVFRDGRLLDLSRLEYDLLLFFARHPRQVFSRGQLLSEVWGHVHTGVRTVDVHVSRLRQKLGGSGQLIATVYGVGYRLADAAPVRVVPPRAGGASWT